MTFKEIPLSEQEKFFPSVLPAGWERVTHRNPITAECGVFRHHDSGTTVLLNVSVENDGHLWKHLSVSRRNGEMPDWFLLKKIKRIFAGASELAIQVFPSDENHYDIGRVTGVDVAHLWAPIEGRPIPDFVAARGGTI